jgi:hypothetical protein
MGFRPKRVVLTYTCGVDERVYDSANSKIERHPAATVPNTTPRPGIGYAEALSFLLGGTSITVVGTAKEASTTLLDVFTSASPLRRVGIVIGGLTLTAAGVGIGYYFGFDDRVKCGEPLFRQLLDDPIFWRGVEQDFLTDHHWTITYSDQLPPYHPFALMNPSKWLKWAPRDGYTGALDEEQELIARGAKFMRILPYKERRVGMNDFLSEGRLAGVLDPARPLMGKAGVRLSPVNLAMPRWRYQAPCNPCLPESIAHITDGLPPTLIRICTEQKVPLASGRPAPLHHAILRER